VSVAIPLLLLVSKTVERISNSIIKLVHVFVTPQKSIATRPTCHPRCPLVPVPAISLPMPINIVPLFIIITITWSGVIQHVIVSVVRIALLPIAQKIMERIIIGTPILVNVFAITKMILIVPHKMEVISCIHGILLLALVSVILKPMHNVHPDMAIIPIMFGVQANVDASALLKRMHNV